jgi:hypothetical protein
MIEQLTPEYWRAKAKEVRAQAAEMHDPADRKTILQLAMLYDGMAHRMEVRLSGRQAAS